MVLPSGSEGKKEKHSCPLPSRPGVIDRHGADGVAMGGGTHTLTHMPMHSCTHTYIHTKIYIEVTSKDSVNHTRSVCPSYYAVSVFQCVCFLARARCIYHVLSWDRMLMYHRKDSL